MDTKQRIHRQQRYQMAYIVWLKGDVIVSRNHIWILMAILKLDEQISSTEELEGAQDLSRRRLICTRAAVEEVTSRPAG